MDSIYIYICLLEFWTNVGPTKSQVSRDARDARDAASRSPGSAAAPTLGWMGVIVSTVKKVSLSIQLTGNKWK